MKLSADRRSGSGRVITLVPLVDAMLILLVFFMVTSTYLDLNMIPLSRTAEAGAAPAGEPRVTLLVRLTPQGDAVFRGQRLAPSALGTPLAAALAARPGSVQILPSPGAPVHALVTAMEAATGAGASDVRILRVRAAP